MTEDGRQKIHPSALSPLPSRQVPFCTPRRPSPKPSCNTHAWASQASAAPEIPCVSPRTSWIYHVCRSMSVGKTRNRRAVFSLMDAVRAALDRVYVECHIGLPAWAPIRTPTIFTISTSISAGPA